VYPIHTVFRRTIVCAFPSIRLLPALLAVCFLGRVQVSAEPNFQGKPLTFWLNECSDTPLMETQRLAKAQTAVLAIGAKKALPIMLRLIQHKDEPLNRWLAEQTEKHQLGFKILPAIDYQLQGIAGFELLGTNCAAAVPTLTQMLRDKDLAFHATRCLVYIGKPAEAALCMALTNADVHTREWAVNAVAAVTDDVEVYIERIKPRLTDPVPLVRSTAVGCIGLQQNAPELAVPLLLSALKDPDDSVAIAATKGLGEFGTNSLPAVPLLTNAVATGGEMRSRAALQCLISIAPKTVFPLLTNMAVNGIGYNPSFALAELHKRDPKLALELSLDAFNSGNPDRQSAALAAAHRYDIHTPEIVDALKAALSSTHSIGFSNEVVGTMRDLLSKEAKAHPGTLKLPQDPEYQGKPLSEWLKSRNENGEFKAETAALLQHLGSHAIPPLLSQLEYRDPTFGLDNYDVSFGAALALMQFRDKAKPALPRLAELMDCEHEGIALRAMIATLGMGRDAAPCLLKGLTNRFPVVRSEAANFLAQGGPELAEARKQAVPYLVQSLNDPDESVRMSATNQLRDIDPVAAQKAGVRPLKPR
jgi:HEAT repeat protein